MAGQSVGLIKDIKSVKNIIDDLVEEIYLELESVKKLLL